MKKRMKRLAAVGLVTVMTGTMLLGCGGGSDSDTTSDGKVKIRFATWDDASVLDDQQACVDKHVLTNLMRVRTRSKLFWKAGDLTLIQR